MSVKKWITSNSTQVTKLWWLILPIFGFQICAFQPTRSNLPLELGSHLRAKTSRLPVISGHYIYARICLLTFPKFKRERAGEERERGRERGRGRGKSENWGRICFLGKSCLFLWLDSVQSWLFSAAVKKAFWGETVSGKYYFSSTFYFLFPFPGDEILQIPCFLAMHICFQYPLFAFNFDLMAKFQRICPIHVFAFSGFRPSYIEFCFQFSTDGVDCCVFFFKFVWTLIIIVSTFYMLETEGLRVFCLPLCFGSGLSKITIIFYVDGIWNLKKEKIKWN